MRLSNGWVRSAWGALAVLSLVVGVGRAAEPTGLESLVAANSPLQAGERIAFLGDSITQQGAGPGGYVRLIDESLQKHRADLNTKIIYAGISGHKVPDLQKRLDRDVLSQKPTLVFIYIGINDVWHSIRNQGTAKDVYEAGLRELIERIRKADATVILATPSVIGEKTDGSNPMDKMLDEYAEISRKVARDTGTPLCDLHQAFASYLKEHNGENKDRGVLTIDGVHLNPAGNKFVADCAATAIVAARKK